MASTRKTEHETHVTQTEHRDKAQVDGKAGGAAVGGAAGAVIGGVAGGPVGAGLGAAAGAAAGGLAGAAFDYDEVEPTFRREFEAREDRGDLEWEQAAPAYKYAWNHYTDEQYHGKSFDDARAELKSHWRGPGHFDDLETYFKTAWEARAQAKLDKGGKVVIPIVEEQLKVGKRKVQTGGVRVESKVVETPVTEQVRLHEEHVEVERRPVDRKVTTADATEAFQEGTLELKETVEEAVVTKTPRVIEEVVIRKEAADRTETVSETVRRTDVDVHETKGQKVTARATTFETHDAAFRKDFGTRFAGRKYTYEQVVPAYRYGYNLAHDDAYRDRDWVAIEPEARRRWEETNRGTWEEFKDAVHHAWMEVTGRR